MKKREERRQLQYVQGSLAVKEQYLPKKRVEKKKIEKKQEQRELFRLKEGKRHDKD